MDQLGQFYQVLIIRPFFLNIDKAKTFNFNLHFLIDKTEPEWNGLVGYISKEMITKVFPAPSQETIILLCGPPVMCERAKELFKEFAKLNIIEND
jgi:NAD(P)H-flavin reductase